MAQQEERIVMTPKKKTRNSTTLMMERKVVLVNNGPDTSNMHVAGGSNAGIVVNKSHVEDDEDGSPPAHLCLQFRVFLVNKSTRRYTQEKRVISYWFKDDLDLAHRPAAAHGFFKRLVSPADFPRDYVGFIKKIMKLMQKDFPMVAKIELQLTQECEMDHLPNRPIDADDEDKEAEVKAENVLSAIEESYPNSLTIDDMSRRFKAEKELVKSLVLELVSRNLVKAVGVGGVPGVDSGASAYRRVHAANEDDVTVVKQMPRVERALQPTIAIITAQYHEKMAVDAVMTNKQTFVRYATVGEANVYTLGDVGSHRVVSTKLPMTGHGRDAAIATGSTTTRLLGTFQDVEAVFLVGAAGAVPHYTDFDRHVRLGDVVVAAPAVHNGFIYEYVEPVLSKSDGEVRFETKSWRPQDLQLQEIAQELVKKYESNPGEAPWLRYFSSAASDLNASASSSSEDASSWSRPSQDTDKLYMSVGDGDVIEVGHPAPKNGTEDPRTYGEPVLHLGPVAAGRKVALDDHLRQDLAAAHSVLCFDAELDAVVESVYGNRKERYVLIKGMADYRDGKASSGWQRYAALMAAAVLRAIVEEMPPP